MNWFDLSVTIAVLTCIAIGTIRGFARTAVGFLAFVLAVCCAFWLYGPLGFWLRTYISSRAWANAAGFLLVFIAISILGGFAERAMVHFVREARLTWLDRLLGAGFGLVQGVVMAAVAALLLMAFVPGRLPPAMMESRSLPYLNGAAHVLASAAPGEVKEGFQRARRDMERAVPALSGII